MTSVLYNNLLISVQKHDVTRLHTDACTGKSVPLQAWSGPEGSRKSRFPDFMTAAQEGGKDVSLMHQLHLTPRKSS